MSTQTQTNHFENVIDEVQSAPQNQKLDKAIGGIAKQMQQSQNQTLTPAQLGQDLQNIKPRLVGACQQQGG